MIIFLILVKNRQRNVTDKLLDRKVRVAVVGAGFFGELHAHTYSSNPLANLVAIVDVDVERAKAVAKTYNVKSYYHDVEELLAKEEVDAISVATPETQHMAPAVAAAKAGKHVLVEKPIAHTLDDAQVMVDTARKSGTKLMVGYILRFDSRYAQAKEQLDQGRIGEIISMWARRVGVVTIPQRVAVWSHPLFYMAIHDIDMLLWFAKSPVTTVYSCSASKLFTDTGKPDVIQALLKFKVGSIAALEVNWSQPPSWPYALDSRLHVTGTKGSLYVDIADMGLGIYHASGTMFPDTYHWPEIRGRIDGDLKEEITHFLECVLSNNEPLVTGEDGIKSLQVALAIMESYRTGKSISP
jgi:predicted dehydrogenase